MSATHLIVLTSEECANCRQLEADPVWQRSVCTPTSTVQWIRTAQTRCIVPAVLSIGLVTERSDVELSGVWGDGAALMSVLARVDKGVYTPAALPRDCVLVLLCRPDEPGGTSACWAPVVARNRDVFSDAGFHVRYVRMRGLDTPLVLMLGKTRTGKVGARVFSGAIAPRASAKLRRVADCSTEELRTYFFVGKTEEPPFSSRTFLRDLNIRAAVLPVPHTLVDVAAQADAAAAPRTAVRSRAVGCEPGSDCSDHPVSACTLDRCWPLGLSVVPTVLIEPYSLPDVRPVRDCIKSE